MQRPPSTQDERRMHFINGQHADLLGTLYNYGQKVGSEQSRLITDKNFAEVLAHAQGIKTPPRDLGYGIDKNEPNNIAISGLKAEDAQRMLTSLNREGNVARLVGEPGQERLLVPVAKVENLIGKAHAHVTTLPSHERVALGVPINGVTYDRNSDSYRRAEAAGRLNENTFPKQAGEPVAAKPAPAVAPTPPDAPEQTVAQTIAAGMEKVDAKVRTLGDGGRRLNADVEQYAGGRILAHQVGVEGVGRVTTKQLGETLEVQVPPHEKDQGVKAQALYNKMADKYGDDNVRFDPDNGRITIGRAASGRAATDLAAHATGIEQKAPGLVDGLRRESRAADLAQVKQQDMRGAYTAAVDKANATGAKPEDVLASQRTGIPVQQLASPQTEPVKGASVDMPAQAAAVVRVPVEQQAAKAQPQPVLAPASAPVLRAAEQPIRTATGAAPSAQQAAANDAGKIDFSKLAGVAQAAAAFRAAGAQGGVEAQRDDARAIQTRSEENIAARRESSVALA